MRIAVTLTQIDDVKKDLGQALPDVKSSHRVEALARGLGWATNAALRADLASGPATREVQTKPFVEYLAEHGFETDGRPLVRAMLRTDIRAVMQANPLLTAFGFGVYDQGRISAQESKKRYDEGRQEMLDDWYVDQFERACEYLAQLQTRKTLNRDFTSYGLKHRAENYHRSNAYAGREGHAYVSNGMLLAAAYHLGLKVRRTSWDSPNGYLNVSTNSVKSPKIPRPIELPPNTDGDPFRVLGHNQGTYFYWLDGQERVLSLRGTAHTPKNLLRLAPLGYWAARFPSRNARAQFDRWHAIGALFRRAEQAGIFANNH